MLNEILETFKGITKKEILIALFIALSIYSSLILITKLFQIIFA